MMRRTIFTISFFVLAVFLTGVVPLEASRNGDFPGGGELVDPTGKWSITWKEASPTQAHALLLKNMKSGKEKHLLWFDRHVSVMWAPGGNAFAVTDYAESSDSIVWIARIEAPERLINVEDAFISSLGRLNEIYENGHRYFKATNWVEATILRFEVDAWDAHPGKKYEGIFYYKIEGAVSRTLEALR